MDKGLKNSQNSQRLIFKQERNIILNRLTFDNSEVKTCMYNGVNLQCFNSISTVTAFKFKK